MKWIGIGLILFLMMIGVASAQMGITFFPGPGMTSVAGGACSPGAPNGQMDFSICSNVGITAAAMP